MSPLAYQGSLFPRPGHKHDLPPRWDGYEVTWDPWNQHGVILICPGLKVDPCSRCRSTQSSWTTMGKLIPTPGMLTDEGGVTRPAHPLYLLHAFRCPDCHLDTVLIRDEGVEVVLDDSDYGDAGTTPAPGDSPIDPGWFYPTPAPLRRV